MLERMNKRRWLILFLVVLVTTVFRLIAQGFMPAGNDNLLPKSTIAQAGLIPVAFTLFGLLFGGMWIAYLSEPLPHVEGLSLIDALAYPIADSTALVLEGLLMGRFIATDSKGNGTVRISSDIVIIASVPIVFLIGRLLSYNIFHIYSSYATRPFATMIWVVATGIWIGIMYYFLRHCSKISVRKSGVLWPHYLWNRLFDVQPFHTSSIRISDMANRSILIVCRSISACSHRYHIRSSRRLYP